MNLAKENQIEFNINCKMDKSWMPHFVAMLRRMEELGSIGSSRLVAIYADGDGGFNPEFDFDIETLPRRNFENPHQIEGDYLGVVPVKVGSNGDIIFGKG